MKQTTLVSMSLCWLASAQQPNSYLPTVTCILGSRVCIPSTIGPGFIVHPAELSLPCEAPSASDQAPSYRNEACPSLAGREVQESQSLSYLVTTYAPNHATELVTETLILTVNLSPTSSFSEATTSSHFEPVSTVQHTTGPMVAIQSSPAALNSESGGQIQIQAASGDNVGEPVTTSTRYLFSTVIVTPTAEPNTSGTSAERYGRSFNEGRLWWWWAWFWAVIAASLF